MIIEERLKSNYHNKENVTKNKILFKKLAEFSSFFIIIIIISAFISNLLKYAGVKSVIEGMKPAVTGIIFATAITMFLKAIFALEKLGNPIEFSYSRAIIFVVVAGCCIGYKKLFKKKINPIILILISAVLGMTICPFIP